MNMHAIRLGVAAAAIFLLAGQGTSEAQTVAAQLQEQGAAIVSRGAAVGQGVRSMLEAARKAGDIIQAGCLDAKLTQIDAVQRIAEQRLEALKDAVDADRRTHEFTVLTVLGQKLQVLDQEAHQCNGQDMYDTGGTSVVMVIDGETITFETTPSNTPVILPPSLPTVPPPASGAD